LRGAWVPRDAALRATASIVLAVVVGAALPTPAEAPAVPAALRKAEKRASLAADARRLPEVQMHLHPARESLPTGSANQVRAQKAIEIAKVGVTFHDFQPAHDSARTVQDVLQEATSPTGTGAAR
jgi:hypothetical protein